MNELMVFEGQNVEVFEFEGSVLFNPKDVGVCLGMTYATVRDHLSQMDCDEVVKLKNSDVGLTNFRKLNNAGENFLTEEGVYALILKSRKPEAVKFQKWITKEVLPSIRRYGMYAKEELLNDPDMLFEVVSRYREERNARVLAEKTIVEMTPKAVFADAVSSSQTSILVGELAKLLKQNGVDIGANRMFEWLRANGYLIKRKGSDWNMPTQRSMELELFEIKETTVQHNDGHISISKTPKVTGKGQLYFVNQFISDGGLVCI